MKQRLGEILVQRGVISPTQLKDALGLQRRKGLRLGEALVRLGHITELELVRTLGTVLNLKIIELPSLVIPRNVAEMVPPEFAVQHQLIPVELKTERGQKTLTVAMSDPLNAVIVDELRFSSGCRIEPVLATTGTILDAVRRTYGPQNAWSERRRSGSIEIEDEEDDTMTILRRGGEEVVRTFSGPAPSRPPPPKDADEVIALTDEIPALARPPAVTGVPASPPPRASSVPPPRRPSVAPQAPVTPQASDLSARAGLPQYPSQAPPPGRITQITDHYGVLVGRGGGVVDAERVIVLEQRLWALLRVLVKKGVLTPDEFLAEIQDRE